MKPKIVLDNWRFEYLKNPSERGGQLRVGGTVRQDDDPEKKNGITLVEEVVDLQGINGEPQFEEGFQLETESRQVTLGKKEQWGSEKSRNA